jgi:hypothetical protein
VPEPQLVPLPPPEADRSPWRWPLLILAAVGMIAPVLYYFSSYRFGPVLEPVPPPTSASVLSQPAPSADRFDAARAIPSEQSTTFGSRDEHAATSIVPPAPLRQANTSPALPSGPSPANETAAAPPTNPGSAKASSPGKPARILSPEQITLLVRQGEQLVSAGDLVAARIVLQRAAEAGNVTAALALATTYDPVVIAKLGVIGVEGDVEKARNWYQEAERLGSAEATRRLRNLARQ